MNKITTKISIIFFVCFLIAGFSAAIVSNILEYINVHKRYENNINNIINQVNINLSRIDKFEERLKYINILTNYKEIDKIILNKDNSIIEFKFNKDSKKKSYKIKEGKLKDGLRYVIYFNNIDAYKEIVGYTIRALISGLIIAILILSGILLSINLMVIKPINLIIKTASQFMKKDFKVRVPVITKDEIAMLSLTFNDMAQMIETYSRKTERIIEKKTNDLNLSLQIQENLNKELKEANEKIKKYSEDLESIVAERTEKLRKANELMKKELIMAQKIQESLIPKIFPDNKKFKIASLYIPMEELGGDYYDFFNISDSKIGIVVADASGHGVPSALITTMAKVSFTANVRDFRTTADIINQVNKDLYSVIGDIDSYLSAFFIIIDFKRNVIQYTGCGHPDFILAKNNGELILIKSNNPLIGIFDDLKFTFEEIKIEYNDRLILYTDGIIEARNINHEFFTIDNLLKIVKESRNYELKYSLKTVIDKIMEFKGETPPDDDITLLMLDLFPDMSEIIFDIDYLIDQELKYNQFNSINIKNSKNKKNKKFKAINDSFLGALRNYKAGNFKAAMDSINGMEEIYNRKYDKFKVFYLKGHLYYKIGEIDEAINCWNQAKSFVSDFSELNHNLEVIHHIKTKN